MRFSSENINLSFIYYFFYSAITAFPLQYGRNGSNEERVNDRRGQEFESEIYRAASFARYTHRNNERTVSPLLLAEAGFVYVGNGETNNIKCYYCNRTKENLQPGDDFDQVHTRDCPMVANTRFRNTINPAIAQSEGMASSSLYRPQNHNTDILNIRHRDEDGSVRHSQDSTVAEVEHPVASTYLSPDLVQSNNVILNLSNIVVEATGGSVRRHLEDTGEVPEGITLVYPEYENMESRLASFDAYFPSNLNRFQFALAGFFYQGDGDGTICYYCGLRLHRWPPEPDPLIEHARNSRDCLYMLQRMQEDSIEVVNVLEARRHLVTLVKLRPLQLAIRETNSPQNDISRRSNSNNLDPVTLGRLSETNYPQNNINRRSNSNNLDPVTLESHRETNSSQNSYSGRSDSNSYDNNSYNDQSNMSNSNTNKNSKDGSEATQHQTLFYNSEFANEKKRRDSFKDPSWPSQNRQSHKELAQAGFYYTGKEDETECYRCGLSLKRWEPSDDPFIEHALHGSNCSHLLDQKGRDFVEAVKRLKNRGPRLELKLEDKPQIFSTRPMEKEVMNLFRFLFGRPSYFQSVQLFIA